MPGVPLRQAMSSSFHQGGEVGKRRAVVEAGAAYSKGLQGGRLYRRRAKHNRRRQVANLRQGLHLSTLSTKRFVSQRSCTAKQLNFVSLLAP